LLEKGRESRFGLMGLDMRDGGKGIWQMETEDLYMQMVTFILDSGKMTKLKEKEHINI
jgi:hypothetical protein